MKPVLSTEDLQGIDRQIEREMKKVTERSYANLEAQVRAEYDLGYSFIKPKWDEWFLRLKLYNNQRRDKSAVGDPLMFTVLMTVLASLYSDQLTAAFAPRERGDEEVAENLDGMAEFDHEDMGKDILDYEWDWDAAFFGQGLCLMMEFDRQRKVPLPQILDPMTVMRDPRAQSVNGGQGRKGSRFFMWESRMTKNDMKLMPHTYFNLDRLKKGGENDIRSVVDRNHEERTGAQNLESVSRLEGGLSAESYEYRVLNTFTIYKNKRVLASLTNDRTNVIRYQEFPTREIPVIGRHIYPMAHDWDGVSVSDLTEDKQRHRSSVQNQSLKGIKASLYPMYAFNSNKIKSKKDLDFGFNKHVPVDGDTTGAITPIERSPVRQEANWILDVLDTAAQRSNATPDIQQGNVENQKRTLGELQLVSAKVDTRYSLTAKIFGWSEKRFWKSWYSLYKTHFKEGIEEKMVRINGTQSYQWRPLTRENIIAKTDPDIIVESKAVSEARKLQMLQATNGYMAAVLQDPTANKRAALRFQGKLTGLKSDEVMLFLPASVDEMAAEEENKILNDNKPVNVDSMDNHMEHLEIHRKAIDTPALRSHIAAHRKAMKVLKVRPDLAPPPPMATAPTENPFSGMADNALPSAQTTRSLPVAQ